MFYRTFDPKNEGYVRCEQVYKILEGKMSKRDIEEMLAVADRRREGELDYKGDQRIR